jgi:phosphatidylserine/phosphatidylglycerophosphate/cardiolipin synthase-like enzyme
MNFARALVFVDRTGDPAAALSALAKVAPLLARVVIIPGDRALVSLEKWRDAANIIASDVALHDAPQLPNDALAELARTEAADLLVAGGTSLSIVRLVADIAQRAGVAMLWPQGTTEGEVRHVFCAALGQRSRAAIAAFLREQSSASWTVSLAGAPTMATGDLASALHVLGIRAQVSLIPGAAILLRNALAVAARDAKVDLIVVAQIPTLLLVAYDWPAPVLLVPTRVSVSSPTLDVCDAIDFGGQVRIRVDEVTLGYALSAASHCRIALLSAGQTVATVVTSSDGEAEVAIAPSIATLGAVRVEEGATPEAMTAADQRFAVVRPSNRPIAIFDAELDRRHLDRQREVAQAADVEPIAVRLRPTRRVTSIRERLRAVGLPPHVIDARAVLDEGAASDVDEANDPVRLRRVGCRLRAAGFDVVSVFDRRCETPEGLRDDRVAAIAGNRVDIELDNKLARTRLLDAITQSRGSVNVQVYMALDDQVGAAIESALAAAAARGVVVRVLVDSLHGLHGSFGMANALLTRMAARPGVELRVGRPLASLPTVMDLKQRDHRKIVIIDDCVALVGGRNLSNEYYTGFDEVSLDAKTPWRGVPWLDGGARIEGPAVAAIAASFLEAWTSAGGASFAVQDCAPVGSVAVRVVDHHGLRDARTLDAYLELIENARSRIDAVNGFPYALEIQHALVRALARGIRVRALTGHVTPLHDATPFLGPWSFARTTATEFVHSRLDPIVEAGGDVYMFALEGMAGWQPELGVVYPHVHGKLMTVDGSRCAIGSANLDITSAYWESEMMVVIEDATVVGAFERRIDELIASSTRIDREDPQWRERARRRQWMRRWPGILAF